MLFDERQITLKDGRSALLRPARVEDAAALIDYLVTTAGETEFILAYPDERAGMTVEQEERFLRGVIESPCNAFIVCEVNGEIAGNCDIHFNPRRKVRHRGGIAIALYKKYWGLGIGTAMFNAMIRVAREKGVKQLELEYIDGNARGRALYEKMGFVQVAEHPDAIMLKDGSMRKLIFMIKKL